MRRGSSVSVLLVCLCATPIAMFDQRFKRNKRKEMLLATAANSQRGKEPMHEGKARPVFYVERTSSARLGVGKEQPPAASFYSKRPDFQRKNKSQLFHRPHRHKRSPDRTPASRNTTAEVSPTRLFTRAHCPLVDGNWALTLAAPGERTGACRRHVSLSVNPLPPVDRLH